MFIVDPTEFVRDDVRRRLAEAQGVRPLPEARRVVRRRRFHLPHLSLTLHRA